MHTLEKRQNGIQPEKGKLQHGKKSTLTTRNVLDKMLEQIKEVNFYNLLKLKGEDGKNKPRQKHYPVVIIEEVFRIAEQHNLGFCKQHGYVYIYNGEFWQLLDKDDLKTFLGKAAEKMGYSWLESRLFSFRDNLHFQFLSASDVPTPELSEDHVLINLANGTVQITPEGMVIRDFAKEDFLTYQLGFGYDPNAECPIFTKFMNQMIPDKQVQDVLAEFFAYIFTSHLKLEKCLLLYGGGANGKSVFFDVIDSLIGIENISNLSLNNLKDENNRALLKDKLLNYGSEIRGNIEADIFKQMVSGEPIQARFKYKNTFIMRNYAKLAFNCNTLPKDVEQTDAYFRRFIIVPFEVTIPKKDQDSMLAKKIIAGELAGVFNWILGGLDRILKNNAFTVSEKIEREIETYKQESNSVWLFLDESGYVKSLEEKKSLKYLYSEYRRFCKDNGDHAVSNRGFSVQLQKQGFTMKRESKGRVVFLV